MCGKNLINIFILLFVCSLTVTGCGDQNEVTIDLPEEEISAFGTDGETGEEVSAISALQRGAWKGFAVYLDHGYFRNHFVSSGWMGDHSDLRINQNWKEKVHSRKSCIKITYTAESSQGNGWSGIYWQNPKNNWGMRENGGFDLSSSKKLTFWARGEKGDEIIREFKMGGISGAYPDTDSMSIGPISLTQEWKQYTMDLSGMDLTYIIGGFCFVVSSMDNPDGMIFYLDDIAYE